MARWSGMGLLRQFCLFLNVLTITDIISKYNTTVAKLDKNRDLIIYYIAISILDSVSYYQYDFNIKSSYHNPVDLTLDTMMSIVKQYCIFDDTDKETYVTLCTASRKPHTSFIEACLGKSLYCTYFGWQDNFAPKYSWKTLYRSPMWARYAVSYVTL